jgi:hypothetical protein
MSAPKDGASATTPTKEISGKLLIISVFGIALAGAAASWLFRYAATHRAAQFWGPDAALIRDAWAVEFFVLKGLDADAPDPTVPQTVVIRGKTRQIDFRRSVHQARGLVHLRNALLEDHSFDWSSPAELPDVDWRWGLEFSPADEREPEPRAATIWFSSDCRWALTDATGDSPPRVVSCRPIAEGLQKMFSEWHPQ